MMILTYLWRNFCEILYGERDERMSNISDEKTENSTVDGQKDAIQRKKENMKFLWIYALALFTAAVLLVVVSSVIQSRNTRAMEEKYKDELNSQEVAISSGKSTIFDIQQERDILLIEVDRMKREIEELEAKIENIVEEKEELLKEIEKKLDEQADTIEKITWQRDESGQLSKVSLLYLRGKYTDAKKTLNELEKIHLPEESLELYTYLAGKLK